MNVVGKVNIISNEVIDFDLSTGAIELIVLEPELQQSLFLELQQNKNQWWLNTEFGLPWLNQVNKNGIFDRGTSNVSDIEAEINRILDKKPAILSYSYIESKIVNRKYTAKIEVTTIDKQKVLVII